jgi:hypothetical protein
VSISAVQSSGTWKKVVVCASVVAIAIGAALFWLASGKPSMPPVDSGPNGAVSSEKNTLAREAYAILNTHCYPCHGKNGAAEGGLNYILDLNRLKERKLVRPGLAEKSRLFRRINNGEMPPEEAEIRPSAAETAIIRKWIDAGAPALAESNPPVAILTPKAELEIIYKDLQNLPERDRRFARYFSIANLSNAGQAGDELQTYRVALGKLVNSLSWNRAIILPRPVDPSKLVFYVDIRDYSWNDRIWGRLLAEYPFGILWEESRISECIELTGGQLTLLRADWFVAHACRTPLYHDILQIPDNEKKLADLLRVDVAENIRQERIARAGFNGSGVSRNNRLLERHESSYGAYWRSYDFVSNSERQNLFAFPLGPDSTVKQRGFVSNGGEVIFALPNGLQGFMLLNDKGERLDKAPAQIVSDPRRPDRAVENGVSCMSCHARGLIPKKDQVRPHVEKNLASFDKEEIDTIKAVYPTDDRLIQLFDQDNERYRRAMQQIGPFTSTEPIANLVGNFEKELDLKTASWEVGLTPEECSELLARSPGLLRVLGPLRIAGGTVQRQVFIQSIPDIAREGNIGKMISGK